jgi:hypothetical protein
MMRLARAAGPLRALLVHGDLLAFQFGNWASAQLLFAIFGAFSAHGALADIAFVETASAFFGTTCATIAFRIGFASVHRTRMLAAARLALLMLLAIAALGRCIEWKWVIGVAPSLLTPAHFPVVYGAKKRAVVFLIGARALACAACVWIALSPAMAFVVYFTPGIAYAAVLYALHFDDWARQPKPGRTERATHVRAGGRQNGGSPFDAFLVLPWASAGLFFMQATIVSHIAAASPSLAVFERLMRSLYSLAYPYLMRFARFDSQLRKAAGVLAFVIPLAGVALRFAPTAAVAMSIPVLIDFVTTNLFRLGQRRLRTLAAWATACALLLAEGL